MGLAGFVVLALIALGIAVVMLWGAFTALVRVSRLLWRFLTQP